MSTPPRRLRAIFIPIFVVSAIFIVLGVPVLVGTPAALIITIPGGLYLFSVGPLHLVYYWMVHRGGKFLRDRHLENDPDAQETIERNPLLSWVVRVSDWSGPDQ